MSYIYILHIAMNKYHAGIVILLAAVVISFIYCPAYGADSGCIKCHTNEKMMRALHKPVKADLSEGVG